MAEGRPNQAIAERLSLEPKMSEQLVDVLLNGLRKRQRRRGGGANGGSRLRRSV
jgi:hypothetical protein